MCFYKRHIHHGKQPTSGLGFFFKPRVTGKPFDVQITQIPCWTFYKISVTEVETKAFDRTPLIAV